MLRLAFCLLFCHALILHSLPSKVVEDHDDLGDDDLPEEDVKDQPVDGTHSMNEPRTAPASEHFKDPAPSASADSDMNSVMPAPEAPAPRVHWNLKHVENGIERAEDGDDRDMNDSSLVPKMTENRMPSAAPQSVKEMNDVTGALDEEAEVVGSINLEHQFNSGATPGESNLSAETINMEGGEMHVQPAEWISHAMNHNAAGNPVSHLHMNGPPGSSSTNGPVLKFSRTMD